VNLLWLDIAILFPCNFYRKSRVVLFQLELPFRSSQARKSCWGQREANEQEKTSDGLLLRRFPTLSLLELDSFSDDEKLLAQVTIGIVRGGGAMYRGRFIE
jgi:hypothetical protein